MRLPPSLPRLPLVPDPLRRVRVPRDLDSITTVDLGLINIMGWADPERALSAALITSGKAILYPELPRFYGVMQRVGSQAPKGPPTGLLV